jgi:hypothetical protein
MIRAKTIKLRAEDAEDLAVIAACLQDAIASLGEMRFEPGEAIFALVVERFLWEELMTAAPSDTSGLHAVRTGLHFSNVRAVRMRGLDQRRQNEVLELLTITSEPGGEATTISLVFAGGGEIRLEVDRIRAWLRDLEAPHPTKLRPRHRVDNGAGP